MPKSSGSGERAPEDIPKRLPPARTRARRAQQLVRLAEDLVEERLRTGRASPTEVTAVLRLGTEIELANVQRINAHTAYLIAQKEKAEADTRSEEMFTRAMEAMSIYKGETPRAPDVQRTD